jgi:hypothetical protein
LPRKKKLLPANVAFLISLFIAQEKEAVAGKRKGYVNKDSDRMVGLIRNILLYQYKMSPNAGGYLSSEASVRVNPFDQMLHIAAPDSIDAICNIYEVFRSMLSLLGKGWCSRICC